MLETERLASAWTLGEDPALSMRISGWRCPPRRSRTGLFWDFRGPLRSSVDFLARNPCVTVFFQVSNFFICHSKILKLLEKGVSLWCSVFCFKAMA